MSIAVHSARRGRAEPGETALVIGAGGIGAFLTYVLSQSDVKTTVVDLDEQRLAVARSLGADTAGRSADPGPHDLVFEVTGTPPGLELALSSAAPGTRVMLIGLQDGPASIEPRQLSLGEIELIGTNAHVFSDDFAQAAGLLASRSEGWSDIAPFALPLHDLVEKGLVPMTEGRPPAIKTLIDPWAGEARPTR
jgi:(R,R)-butanediol dehydrogenase/meso-butanediol dehydrogenase/diacetyl reductase